MDAISKFLMTFTAVFVFLMVSCFADDSAPEIEYTVTIQEEMKKALDEFDPGFKMWNQSDFAPVIINEIYDFSISQTPSAVIGDFNGDSVKDIALYGRNNTHLRIICILSDGIDFKVYEIESYELKKADHHLVNTGPNKEYYGLNTYLIYNSPGIVDSPHEENSVELKTDAFEIVQYECSARIEYFQNGAFHEYWTAD